MLAVLSVWELNPGLSQELPEFLTGALTPAPTCVFFILITLFPECVCYWFPGPQIAMCSFPCLRSRSYVALSADHVRSMFHTSLAHARSTCKTRKTLKPVGVIFCYHLSSRGSASACQLESYGFYYLYCLSVSVCLCLSLHLCLHLCLCLSCVCVCVCV